MFFLGEWKTERYIFIIVISITIGIFTSWSLYKTEIYFLLSILFLIFRNKRNYLILILFSVILGFFYSNIILEKVDEKSSIKESKTLTILIEGNKKNNYTGEIMDSGMKIFIKRKISFYYSGNLEIGEIYRGDFKLEKFKLQRIPKGFDEKKYYFSNNVFYKGKGKNFQLITDSKSIYSGLLKFRKKIMEDYREKFTGKAQGLIPALIFGDKSLFPDETRDSFQLLGLSHLLAVSGLHGGIIAGAAYRIFAPGGFYIKNAAAWLLLFIYAFLAGFSPSINRAALMFFLFSIRKIYLRYPDPWTIISLSALPQIFINPFVVFSAGFQLSYLTISGIVIFHKNKKSNLSLSFAALAGTAPIVIYYFNKISLAGIVINLFYVPLFAIITFLAMAGLFLPFNSISLYLNKFVNFVISGTEKLSEFFHFLDINISTPEPWEMFLYYCLLYLIVNNKNLNIKVLFVIMLLLLSINFYPKSWEITFLDVGQGDSTFISTKKERTILVDGGPWGRDVENFLSSRGINKPDLFVVSHGDADHINGIIWLMKTHPPKSILLPVNSEPNKLLNQLIDLANKNNVKIIYGYAGLKFYIDDTQIEILSPSKTQKYITSNNHSLVLLVTYENKKVLLTGDIEKEVMEDLVIGREIHILKAPHHGSNTGVSKKFFFNESIKSAVISCGENNRYGHPGEEFLELFEVVNIPYLRTDKKGTITFMYKGKKDFYIKTILD
jgi:competence protein ComEC